MDAIYPEYALAKPKLSFSYPVLRVYYCDLPFRRSRTWALRYTLRALISIESHWQLCTTVVNIFQICDTTLRGQYIKRIARQQSWIRSQRHSCLSVCICFRNGRYLFMHRRVWWCTVCNGHAGLDRSIARVGRPACFLLRTLWCSCSCSGLMRQCLQPVKSVRPGSL